MKTDAEPAMPATEAPPVAPAPAASDAEKKGGEDVPAAQQGPLEHDEQEEEIARSDLFADGELD